ncbi:MAG: ATP-dependent helicase, partial [Deltaproteobacteria bacterium]|jgi:superfamily I DNA/RNA helicase|nr:ATP-dependent helicase [Deltaproteobacteria bacterium]
MIVAGPGTGKTRTLTHRIAWYILKKKIEPGNILAVTFTHKAAYEMRERLQLLLGDGSQLPWVATFHGFCLKLLKDRHPQRKMTIIDDDERRRLVSEALKRAQTKDKKISMKPQTALRNIIEAKQRILDPDEYERRAGAAEDSQIRQTGEIYRIYQQILSIQQLHDYEDLIFNVVRLLESDLDVSQTYRQIFRHIFVDEYQDLNQGQYRIIRALAPPESPNRDICIIGDPDQSIYGFRGSNVEYFKRFGRDYAGAQVIHLARNYRSTKTILDASYQVIRPDPMQSGEVRTYSQIDGVRAISIITLSNEKYEAEAIARIIENRVGGTGFHSIDTGRIADANVDATYSYSDFAVLYRTHAQHRIIAQTFEKNGIPFQIASRQTALKQPGLADLISYLKVLSACAVFGDYETVIQLAISGIGKKSLTVFRDWCYQNQFSPDRGLAKAKRFPIPGLSTAQQQGLNEFLNHINSLQSRMNAMTVCEKLIYLVNNSKLKSRFNDEPGLKDALETLLQRAEKFDRHTDDFLASLALHADTDAYTVQAEKVSLMTMHAAKGLEFPVVFVSGCEQGLIPLKPQSGELLPEEIEEERRLFYVAMTRAMERLYFTRARKRRIYGRFEPHIISPFAADIEARLKLDESPNFKKKKKSNDQKQLTLF